MSRYSLAVGIAPAEEIAHLARQAEDAGFEALWAAEMSHEPFLPLAAAATSTSRIQLGTSIALAFVRSPWVTALSALDMDMLSGGRFILGLGTGLKRLNERWHGVAYGKPTPHIKECIQVIRLITENAHLGRPIRFSGQYYDLDIQGWQRPFPPVRERIPVFLAGVREGMIRTAAEIADGLLGHAIYSLPWIRQTVLPSVARGLAQAGRERNAFHLCLTVCCAAGKDRTAARRAAAATIAFYATVNTYEPLFAAFGEEYRRIQSAVMRGDTAEMVDAVSEQMIDAFAVAGTPDEVRGKLSAYAELADSICLAPPDQLIDPAETEEYRRALLATFGR
ncbi:MAG: LLM class flavin-dependent oxidoreductase [Dehalococcoidia bacterium]|nr:LLM class flavin-dependent oxidoreductase [Dehalococcoidia bacterium]